MKERRKAEMLMLEGAVEWRLARMDEVQSGVVGEVVQNSGVLCNFKEFLGVVKKKGGGQERKLSLWKTNCSFLHR